MTEKGNLELNELIDFARILEIIRLSIKYHPLNNDNPRRCNLSMVYLLRLPPSQTKHPTNPCHICECSSNVHQINSYSAAPEMATLCGVQ